MKIVSATGRELTQVMSAIAMSKPLPLYQPECISLSVRCYVCLSVTCQGYNFIIILTPSIPRPWIIEHSETFNIFKASCSITTVDQMRHTCNLSKPINHVNFRTHWNRFTCWVTVDCVVFQNNIWEKRNKIQPTTWT